MIGSGDDLSNGCGKDDATKAAQVKRVRQYAKKYQETLMKDNNNLTQCGGEDFSNANSVIATFK